ncbi:unnamed protein product [Cladocopium goreaui]|uniref:GTP cyclohydrolase 1 n=1 Tax=Cladocopium goreaui TaxID=2562237 RepID=A0A9P1CJW2_9DINO|nr:unnamed protein product [Cladocopium goreaui]
MEFSAVPLLATHGCLKHLEPMHDYSLGITVGCKPQHDLGKEVRKILSQICCRLDQRTLLPHCSEPMTIRRLNDSEFEIKWQDEVTLMLPLKECCLLPIAQCSAEELAEYLATEALKELSSRKGGAIQWLEVKVSDVSEKPVEKGCFKASLPDAIPSFEAGECPRAKPYKVAEDEVKQTPTPPVSQVGSDAAEDAYRLLLSTLGIEESSRHELEKTPARAAKAFREMTIGLQVEYPLSVAGDAVFDVDGAHDLVAVREIPFHSLCEHHLLPFAGTAHIAYFPNGRVLGLSKFARLLEVFARRLQLQERLGHQLAEALVELLGPKAVAVSLEAYHTCMSHRGAGVPSRTRTIALRGLQKDDPFIREQLLSGVSR